MVAGEHAIVSHTIFHVFKDGGFNLQTFFMFFFPSHFESGFPSSCVLCIAFELMDFFEIY